MKLRNRTIFFASFLVVATFVFLSQELENAHGALLGNTTNDSASKNPNMPLISSTSQTNKGISKGYNITPYPLTLKDSIPKGSVGTMSLVLHADGNTNITAAVTDLVPQGLPNATDIPSSYATLNRTMSLDKTDLSRLVYSVMIPPNQTSGTYNGTLILLTNDAANIPTEIPIQITVFTKINYYIVFGFLVLGTVFSGIWTAHNDIKPSNKTVPSAPTNLVVTATLSSQINLSWNEPSDSGSSPITGYQIERSVDNGTNWSTIKGNTQDTTTSYSDTDNLVPNTKYTYRVSAINSGGSSQPSNTVSVTTPTTNGKTTSAKKSNNSRKLSTVEKVVLRASFTAISSVLAVAFVFAQLLQSYPNFAELPMGGWYVAMGAGFLAHHALDNFVDQTNFTLQSPLSVQH